MHIFQGEYLEFLNHCFLKHNVFGQIEHHDDGQGAEQELPRQVHVMDSAGYCHTSLSR